MEDIFRSHLNAMVSHKLDITYAIGVIIKFMSNPIKEHCQVGQWIFKYLRGISKYNLYFVGDYIDVRNYVNIDHSGDRDNDKNKSRYIILTIGKTTVNMIFKSRKNIALF